MKTIFPIILFLIILFSSSAYGQKIKYKNVKDSISLTNYRQKIENPKYSPLLAGVCNYLIPSSGYFYIGEPVRGLYVLGGELISGGVFMYGLATIMNFAPGTNPADNNAMIVMLAGLVSMEAIFIWSIFDVIKVAKVKNLAYQYNNVSVSLSPTVLPGYQQPNGNNTAFGLKLHINF